MPRRSYAPVSYTHLIRILEWLIEGSTYLKCYDGVKLNDSRMLVERHLDEAIASREAIRLIDTEAEGDYVTDKLQKLTLSGYLFKKSLVWITITTIAVSYTHLDVYKRQIYNYSLVI